MKNKILHCIFFSLLMSGCFSPEDWTELNKNKTIFEQKMEIKESSTSCYGYDGLVECSAITQNGFPIKYKCYRFSCEILNK